MTLYGIGLKPDAILKVLRPFYGVLEAGNNWFNTYHRHHLEQLGMHQSTFDPCLLFYNNKNDKNDNGFGIVGMQTDDTLLLTDEAFAEAEENRL